MQFKKVRKGEELHGDSFLAINQGILNGKGAEFLNGSEEWISATRIFQTLVKTPEARPELLEALAAIIRHDLDASEDNLPWNRTLVAGWRLAIQGTGINLPDELKSELGLQPVTAPVGEACLTSDVIPA